MADAQDEAIDCMISAGLDLMAVWRDAPGLHRLAVGMLDAIPKYVLAQYARERGAVIDVVIVGDDWRAYDLADGPDGRSGSEHPPTIALYRLATEDET